VIEPTGADGFLHRFLAARGPGPHHVTFEVPSLADAVARAEAAGYRVVGRDESDDDWRVAYLHPKEALGLVVQLGQSGGRYGRRPWEVPVGPSAPPPAARVLGLRTAVRSADRARQQWERALGGTLAHATERELVFRWPRSPMRVLAEIAPDAEEGAVAIDLGPGRDPGLPAGPVPLLGTVFRIDTQTPER
jgi:methylmalonyl-CoA/ethylmalonyl-CoA epimerase